MLQEADLIIFMGQSNMAGRGIVCGKWPQPAPQILPGAGYEFRPVSDPAKLYPVTEPFGVYENREDGINDVFFDGWQIEEGLQKKAASGCAVSSVRMAKTGSSVTAFCNAYYKKTGIPVVAVSASKGGSHIAQWQPESKEGYLKDAVSRFRAAEEFLLSTGCQIRHRFLVWCQGETDGDLGTKGSDYKKMFDVMMEKLRETGIEKCFLIKIGYSDHHADDAAGQLEWDRQYGEIQDAQEQLARTMPDVVMVSRILSTMRERELMKDAFHYYQQAYNECGEEAGKAAGEFMEDY